MDDSRVSPAGDGAAPVSIGPEGLAAGDRYLLPPPDQPGQARQTDCGVISSASVPVPLARSGTCAAVAATGVLTSAGSPASRHQAARTAS